MDMFIEKMVARRRRGKDYVMAAATVFLTLLLSLISFFLIGSLPVLLFLVPFLPLILGGLIFICYRIIAIQNIEFEYSLTNNELDIDKIFARRRRKRALTLNIQNIEILAPITNPQYQNQKSSANPTKIYDCSSGTGNSMTYFTVFFGNDGQKSILLFEPNEKMIDGFKRYNPGKVFEV